GSAGAELNGEPDSCMPSPESPAKRTMTCESCSTGLATRDPRRRYSESLRGYGNDMSTVLPRRPRSWTPKAIPFGTLILLLGLWAIFAPLVGGYFGFGFHSDATWQFPANWWEIHFAGGLAAAIGGFMLMTPARGWGALGRLLAFLGGSWL